MISSVWVVFHFAEYSSFSPLRFDFYFCLTVQPSGSEGGLTFQELEMEMHTLIQQPNFRNNIEENIQDSNNQEDFLSRKASAKNDTLWICPRIMTIWNLL